MDRFFLGIDIGGTKTRIGLVPEEDPSRVFASATIPTPKSDPEKIGPSVAGELSKLLPPKACVLSACACAPGPLNTQKRSLGFLPNLPAWSSFPLGDALETALSVPVVLQNDATAAAYGELLFGAGRRLTDFIFVTLGTGIGGAVVSGGRPVYGGLGGAGEIGHVQVDPVGPLCGCGRKGCVETYASGPSIERDYGKPASEAFSAAVRGEFRARDVLERAGRALGAGLAPLITVLEPQAVVLGGGMAQVGDEALSFYVGPCRDEALRRAYRMWDQDVPFLVATLGNDAPVLGAAYEARQLWELSSGAVEDESRSQRQGIGESLHCSQAQIAGEGYGSVVTLNEPGGSIVTPDGAADAETLTTLIAGPEDVRKVAKPWGEETWWAQTGRYVGKRILVMAGHSLSLQYHAKKMETMHFTSGEGTLLLGDREIPIYPGLTATIVPGTVHRVTAATDVVFLEVSTPEVDDVVRLEDRYGR